MRFETLVEPWLNADLDRFPSEREAKAALRKARLETWPYTLMIGLAAAVAELSIFGMFVWSGPLSYLVRQTSFIAGLAIFSLAALCCSMAITILGFRSIQHRIRRSLWRQLRELRTPICDTCGFDLRGTALPRCPECGNLQEPATAPVHASGDERPKQHRRANRYFLVGAHGLIALFALGVFVFGLMRGALTMVNTVVYPMLVVMSVIQLLHLRRPTSDSESA